MKGQYVKSPFVLRGITNFAFNFDKPCWSVLLRAMLLSSICQSTSPAVYLRATSKDVRKIDVVPPKYTGCVRLYISHNLISSLVNIDQFHFLRKLMIEYNNIRYIEDLRPLSRLELLNEIRLEGNPVCSLPFWKYHLISFCSSLVFINNKLVDSTKAHIATVEVRLLDSLFVSDLSSRILPWYMKTPRHYDRTVVRQTIKELKKESFQAFNNSIREQCSTLNPDEYFEKLKEICLEKQAEIAELIKEEKPEKLSEVIEVSKELEKCTEFHDLARTMQKCAGYNMALMGFEKSSELSDLLRHETVTKTERVGRESLSEMATRVLDIATKEFDIPKPKQMSITAKTFTWSKCRDWTSQFMTPESASKTTRCALSNIITNYKSDAVLCVLDSDSKVSYHEDFVEKKKPCLVIEDFDDSSDDGDMRVGLSFDAQLDAELSLSGSESFGSPRNHRGAVTDAPEMSSETTPEALSDQPRKEHGAIARITARKRRTTEKLCNRNRLKYFFHRWLQNSNRNTKLAGGSAESSNLSAEKLNAQGKIHFSEALRVPMRRKKPGRNFPDELGRKGRKYRSLQLLATGDEERPYIVAT